MRCLAEISNQGDAASDDRYVLSVAEAVLLAVLSDDDPGWVSDGFVPQHWAVLDGFHGEVVQGAFDIEIVVRVGDA